MQPALLIPHGGQNTIRPPWIVVGKCFLLHPDCLSLLALASAPVINLHGLSPDCLRRLLARSGCPWWGVAPPLSSWPIGSCPTFPERIVLARTLRWSWRILWLGSYKRVRYLIKLFGCQGTFMPAGIKLLPSGTEKGICDLCPFTYRRFGGCFSGCFSKFLQTPLNCRLYDSCPCFRL